MATSENPLSEMSTEDDDFIIPDDHLRDIEQGREDIKNREYLTSAEFSERYKHVFVIPEHMKDGIKEANEDIKNSDVYSMEDFEKRYGL